VYVNKSIFKGLMIKQNTCMIFAAVLSPTIKIFHRHLGPNLYIFVVKVSP